MESTVILIHAIEAARACLLCLTLLCILDWVLCVTVKSNV